MKKEFLLISALLLSPLAYSSTPEAIDSLINLRGVVVSANKIAVNRNSVPLSISVIGREEIEASSESALLPVLSERVPGLFVTEKGITGFGISSGSAGTVNIRGVGQGNKVLMMFDGQPQWAGVFGHSLPDTYVASDIERVEVIRGPGSLLYGSNAMGGVVNIITRHHQKEGRRTQARLMYGSFNTQKYMVNNGYNVGSFSSFISINHDRTDGHRPNSKFHITNGFANLGYKINSHYRVTGDVSLAKFKTQNPGMVAAPLTDNVMDILRGTTSFALENDHGKTSGAIRAFFNWGNHEVNDGYKSGGKPKPFLFYSDDHNAGVQLYQSFRLFPGNSFTAGVDYKNWGGHAWNDSVNGRRGEIVDRSVHEVAGYVVMQQNLFDKLSLNAGVRYDHSSAYGGEWVPQAGLTYRPFEGNTLRASFSKGFRSPNLRELYISYLPYSKANPNLVPEKMLNYEVAIGQYLLDNRLHAELTAFYIDGKDMVQPVKGMLSNIGRFYNKGFEVEASYRALANLSFSGNYSFLHTNKVLVGAPKHKLFVEGVYSVGRLDLSVSVQSIWGLYQNTLADAPAKEDYAVLNARASYRFGTRDKGLSLFVKGDNLTATRYSINEGFPMPKALFMGGVDVSF